MISVLAILIELFFSYFASLLISIAIGAAVDKVFNTKWGVIIATVLDIAVCLETIFSKSGMPARDFARGTLLGTVAGWILIVLYIIATIVSLFVAYVVLHHGDIGTRRLLSRIFGWHYSKISHLIHHLINTYKEHKYTKSYTNTTNTKRYSNTRDNDINQEIKDHLKHM